MVLYTGDSMKFKKILLYGSLILCYAVVVTGSTYAYLDINNTNNVVQGTVGCFDVSYTGERIRHTNLSATTNYLEGAKSTVTVAKTTSCKIYTEAQIFIHIDDSTTAPIDTVQALKYKVMQGSTNISSGVISSKNTEILLATVPITTTTTNYNIYIWVDSSISNKQYDEVDLSGYIYAVSTQSSTVGG